MSYRPADVTRVETSAWKTRQCTITIEVTEEFCSYGGNVARVEASRWKGGQFSFEVEAIEEAVSYGGDLARVETSCR